MKTCYSIVILLAIFSGLGFGQAQNRVEKRSTIVEVNGYAFLAEDKTIKKVREEALAIAKREALERAKTYIRSFTKIENYVLDYDLIETQAEGFVKILESKDMGSTADNRYRYWIRAEVEFILKMPKPPAEVELIEEKDAPLTVELRTDKNVYTSGEEVKIYLKGNKDFYGRVLYQDVEGNLLQILPNLYRQKNFFNAGEEIVIPAHLDKFKLRVKPPFGIETVIVYASVAELGDLRVQEFQKNLFKVEESLEESSTKSRALEIVRVEETGAEEDAVMAAEFYEVRCQVTTQRK